jgi:CheY-like chemotaxis protein
MSTVILGQRITRVKVVDDDARARAGTALTVKDANLEPFPTAGPLPALAEFVRNAKHQSDAVVCDHRMRGRYASFDGAEAVARLCRAKCPAVLCTAWTKADIDTMRQYLPDIPSLISTDDMNPDTLLYGFEVCIREFKNDPIPSRRPWRTLIRVKGVSLDTNPKLFFVSIPGWDSKEVIRLPLDLISADKRPLIHEGFRFFAKVNKGTDRSEMLFFSEFEIPPMR